VKFVVPLVLGIVAGWIGFGEMYVPHPHFQWFYKYLGDVAVILAATAFILGGLNVVQVNWPKVKRREADWQYKVVLLVAAVIMGIAGMRLHAVSADRQVLAGPVAEKAAGREAEGAGRVRYAPGEDGQARLVVHAADRRALVRIDGGDPLWANHRGDPAATWDPPGDNPLLLSLEPGRHTVAIAMPVEGYEGFEATIVLEPGMTAVVEADLPMYWGAESGETGRVYTWLYDHVFSPCNKTMFALLAFFIASAAFRAFRARNVEAGLLLGAAILVMIGLVPIGRAVSDFFPAVAEWIVEFPNNAGRRAIMMGAALGGIATGLRIVLGLERSHLGKD
jgi:hypothetical protein